MDAPRPPILEDRPESWPVTASSDLYRDDWVVALRADLVRRPGAAPGEEPFRRLVLEHPGAVVVLAVDDEGAVPCLAQYRHPARHRFVELPAGLCDEPGEDPVEVARRELREEVGLAAGEWTHLTSAWSSPGISAELIHYYLATDLEPVAAHDFEPVHEEADMQVLRVPFDDLHRAVLEGRVTDAPLVLAVLMASGRGLVGGVPEAPRGE
jgi:ADP-ribose pyrophosphatase